MGADMVANKEPVCREYTVNLHKEMHGISFKRRAPRAIKVIKAFAKKQMGTSDVRLDQALNKEVWSKGIKSGPPACASRYAACGTRTRTPRRRCTRTSPWPRCPRRASRGSAPQRWTSKLWNLREVATLDISFSGGTPTH